jgi:hypothetical protein
MTLLYEYYRAQETLFAADILLESSWLQSRNSRKLLVQRTRLKKQQI